MHVKKPSASFFESKNCEENISGEILQLFKSCMEKSLFLSNYSAEELAQIQLLSPEQQEMEKYFKAILTSGCILRSPSGNKIMKHYKHSKKKGSY